MKRCPQCNRTYTDDALSFCLDDGSPLVGTAAPSSFDPSATVQYPSTRDTSPQPTIAYPSQMPHPARRRSQLRRRRHRRRSGVQCRHQRRKSAAFGRGCWVSERCWCSWASA